MIFEQPMGQIYSHAIHLHRHHYTCSSTNRTTATTIVILVFEKSKVLSSNIVIPNARCSQQPPSRILKGIVDGTDMYSYQNEAETGL